MLGHGAGTYRFSWDELRSIPMSVIDAHSLYLESFAELGLVGGLLVLGLVGGLLWIGFAAWRGALGASREALAALLAAALVFAVGRRHRLVLGDRRPGGCLLPRGRRPGRGPLPSADPSAPLPTGNGAPPRDRRFAAAVAGMAVAWISAIALIGPLLVEREIVASQNAVSDGDLVAAVDHADTARSIEPWAASPYLQLGLVAERRGEPEVAVERLSQAIDREDANWALYELRARVEDKAGEPAAAAADRREAHRLNPLARQQLREEAAG